MNKQEFHQILKDMKPPKNFTYISARDAYEKGFEEAKGTALFNSCFLDEPEKPVVPQFVANWYEEHKNELDKSIYLAINATYRKANAEDKAPLSAFEIWLMDVDNSIETLVLMHQFGYKVEEKLLYTAEFKLTGDYLLWNTDCDEYQFCDCVYGNFTNEFTKGHLKQLGIWNSPMFEIKQDDKIVYVMPMQKGEENE